MSITLSVATHIARNRVKLLATSNHKDGRRLAIATLLPHTPFKDELDFCEMTRVAKFHRIHICFSLYSSDRQTDNTSSRVFFFFLFLNCFRPLYIYFPRVSKNHPIWSSQPCGSEARTVHGDFRRANVFVLRHEHMVIVYIYIYYSLNIHNW